MTGIRIDNNRVYIRQDENAPTDVQIENMHNGSNVYSEFRAVVARPDGSSSAGDFGIVGHGFTDGTDLKPNEVFVIAESTANGLCLRTNNTQPVRIQVDSREVLRVLPGGVEIKGAGNILQSLKNTLSGVDVVTLADDGGNGYIGTRSNNKFHLMANNQAKVTIHQSGVVEIWNTPSPPAANSAVGGALYVENGALKFRGGNGTITVLANA